MKLVKMSIIFKKQQHFEALVSQLFALVSTTENNFLFLLFKKVFKNLLTIFLKYLSTLSRVYKSIQYKY